MSTHKECGEQIRWAQRPDDPNKWMPPLEAIGPVYIIDEAGQAIAVTGYQVHNCDPDRMQAWVEYKNRIASIQGGDAYARMTEHDIAREQRREEYWELALKHPCPTCGVKKKVRCLNRLDLRKGIAEPRENTNPHPLRLEMGLENQ